MPGKFCVSLTCAKDNTDKATVAFVVANAAVGSDKETMVFLSTEGVRLSQRGYSDDIREEGFAPVKELMDNFAKAGGKIFVCSPCFANKEAQRQESGGWSRHRRRREARRVLERRFALHHILSRMMRKPHGPDQAPFPQSGCQL